MDFTNKRILITGGSLGIGLQLARTLLAEGARVMVCARSQDALDAAKRETPALEAVSCEITDHEQVTQLHAAMVSLWGGIDILINNAAVFQRLDLRDTDTLSRQLLEIDINLKGTVRVTGVFLDALLQSEAPVIVNLTSALGFTPMTAAPVYSATKAAINSWTVSLRHQLRDTPARVVLLSPPVVDTRMNADNPDVEGMTFMTPERFAALTLQGLKRGRDEILVTPVNSFKYLSRFLPGQAFRFVNPA